jgi:hypothetical protein
MPDKTFDILIDIQARAQAIQDTSNQLKQLQAQATATNAALGNVSAPQKAQQAVDWNALANERASAMAKINSYDEQNLNNAEKQALTQAAIELQMERRVITETQIEAAEARIAGNTALAARLEREAEIRTRALSIQRALNVTTEESIALAEKLVIAQEAGVAPTLLAGANLNKAKGEAIVLAREIATGSVNARTLGALLGSLGTSITIASLVGYEFFQVIAHAADEEVRLNEEVNKYGEELVKATVQWHEMALAATDLGDEIKLAEKIQAELDKVESKLAEFRNKDLEGWRSWVSSILVMFASIAGEGARVQQAARDILGGPNDRAIEALQRYEEELRKREASELAAARTSSEAWEKIKAGALDVGIDEYTRKVDALKTKLAGIDRAANPQDWIETAKALDLAQKRSDELSKSQIKLSQETSDYTFKERQSLIDQARLRGEDVDALQHQLSVDVRIAELRKSQQDALKQGKVTQAEINSEAEREVTNAERTKEAKQGTRDAQKELNAQLREQAALIESIHQKQQLIDANVFLSPDQKQAATVENMRAEMAALDAQIAADKELLKGSTLDPETYERVLAEIQKLQFQYDLLGVKTQALAKPFSAELANYFNSFGTSAKQAADVVTGSLNAALQGTNKLLLDSIFRTGNWKQSLVGVEEQIAQLFLTFIEKQAAQFIAAEIQKATSTTTSTAAGGKIAAAHAPAAAAVGISSYGVAGIVAEVIVLAAIAAIMAALGGAFEEGGYTGGRRRRPAGIVHGEEFVFPADVVDKLGLPFLQKLTDAAKGSASGTAIKAATAGFDPRDFEGGIPRGGIDIGGGYGPGGGAPYWPGEVIVRQPTQPYVGSVPAPAPYVPPGWVVPPVGGYPVPGTYPVPSGPAAGDWAQNARRGTTPTPSTPTAPWGFGPGYVDPQAAFFQSLGLANWNAGSWAPNKIGGEGAAPWRENASANWLANHPIGHGSGGKLWPAKFFALGGEVDTEHAMLSIGEFVARKSAVDYYGPELFHALNNMRIPASAPLRMQGGGLVGGSSSSGMSGVASLSPVIHIFAFTDKNELQNAVLNSDAHKKIFVDLLHNTAHEIGINAV